MRISGNVVPLMFAGRFYQVLVEEVAVVIERFPQLATYAVSCLIVSNPMLGGLGALVSTLGDVVGADMATAMSIARL